MINKLIEPIETALEGISWVDNFIGVVRPIRKSNTTLMVACGGNDCYDRDGKLRSVTPDDKYKTMIVIENPQGIEYGSFFNRNQVEVSAPIIIKVWLNMNKIGTTDCDAIYKAINEVVKSISDINWSQSDLQNYLVSNFRTIPNDPQIFANYTGWRDNWSIDPYQYFTVQATINCKIRTSCLDFLSEGNEIEC